MKLIPVMVTVLPTLPATGLMPLTAGQVSAGERLKFAFEISKKTLPTASTFIRAVELRMPLGNVTPALPSLGVLAARTMGKVWPPSVESVILTFAQLTGAAVVLATFQVTVRAPLQLSPPFGAVTAKGPAVVMTVS